MEDICAFIIDRSNNDCCNFQDVFKVKVLDVYRSKEKLKNCYEKCWMLDEFLESSLEPFKTLETIIFSSNKDKRETTQSQNQSQRDCRCNLKSGVLDSQ